MAALEPKPITDTVGDAPIEVRDSLSRRFSARSRDDWMEDVGADPCLLRDLIAHLRNGARPPELRNQVLAKEADIAVPAIRRMMLQGDAKPLNEQARKRLLVYLLEKAYPHLELSSGRVDTSDPTTLQDVVLGMTRFLRVGTEMQLNLKTRLTGLYWVYRRSVVDPSKYLRGLIAMWWIDNELINSQGMIRVCEVHRSSSKQETVDATPELTETYDGFALIKKGTAHIFLAERYSEHDRGPLLIVRLHHFVPSEHALPMQVARGWLPGAGDTGLALPVVLVRVGNPGTTDPSMLLEFLRHHEADKPRQPHPRFKRIAELHEHCNLVRKDEIPSLVASQLESMSKENEQSEADRRLRMSN